MSVVPLATMMAKDEKSPSEFIFMHCTLPCRSVKIANQPSDVLSLNKVSLLQTVGIGV